MKNLLIITIIIPFNLLSQYTNIPDENFELALLNLGYDFVIDGELLVELPNEPVIAGEEAFGFWHSFASANDIYGISQDEYFFYL